MRVLAAANIPEAFVKSFYVVVRFNFDTVRIQGVAKVSMYYVVICCDVLASGM